MNVSASSYLPMPGTDVASLRLEHKTTPDDLAQSLEAVFASMLLKEMRSTLADGLFGGEQSDIMGGLFDLHLGEAMAAGDGLGVKQLVLANLDRMAS